MKTTNFKGLKVFMLTLILALIGLSTTSVYADGGYVEEKEEPKQEIKIIKEEKKDIEIRYPNKLEPKLPPKDLNSKNTDKNTNKGKRTEQSKARATVIENVNNANKEYPIYHGIAKSDILADTSNNAEDVENLNDDLEDKYAADARQFITFQTKNGKTFHLIINHNEKTENVMLLTEVSEDDLLNMVEVKEKKEVVKKVEEKPIKEPVKEEKDNTATYLIVFLVVGAAIIGGYYFKTHKKKEEDELLSYEEPDDGYISEAEETEEADEELDDDELL